MPPTDWPVDKGIFLTDVEADPPVEGATLGQMVQCRLRQQVRAGQQPGKQQAHGLLQLVPLLPSVLDYDLGVKAG